MVYSEDEEEEGGSGEEGDSVEGGQSSDEEEEDQTVLASGSRDRIGREGSSLSLRMQMVRTFLML